MALAPSSTPSLVLGEIQWLGVLVLPPSQNEPNKYDVMAQATIHIHLEPRVCFLAIYILMTHTHNL